MREIRPSYERSSVIKSGKPSRRKRKSVFRIRECFLILFIFIFIFTWGYDSYLYRQIDYQVVKNLETLDSTSDPLKSSMLVGGIIQELKEKKLTDGLVSFFPKNPFFEVYAQNQEMGYLLYRLELAEVQYNELNSRLEEATPRPINKNPKNLDKEFITYLKDNPKVRRVIDDIGFVIKKNEIDATLYDNGMPIIPKNLHLGTNLRWFIITKFLSLVGIFVSFFWSPLRILAKIGIPDHILRMLWKIFHFWRG